MLGRDSTASGSKTAQIAPIPRQVGGPTRMANSKVSSDSEGQAMFMFPFVLAVGVALYFVWALLEQHEKLKSAIQPKQIGINLRNLLVIMVTVVLGLNLFKVGAVKLSAFVSKISGGRFRVRWLVYLAGGA